MSIRIKRPSTDRKRCFFCKRKRAQHFIQWHSAAKVWECSDTKRCAQLVISDSSFDFDGEPTLLYEKKEAPRHRCYRCKRKRAAHYLGKYIGRWQCVLDIGACYSLESARDSW